MQIEADGRARVVAAELGVAAIADGQNLETAIHRQIDQRGAAENAVGDQIQLEPVEDRADQAPTITTVSPSLGSKSLRM